MKRYLAATALSQMWDTQGTVLLLGPWCLTQENKRLLEGKDYFLLPSPWKPALRLKEAADHCYDVYLNLLSGVAAQLNLLHGVSYPLRYWQILIGPWLLSFTKIFYERYKRIENASQLFPDAVMHALPIERCDLSTYDTQEFMIEKVNNDAYNLKIFSAISHALRPQNLIMTQPVPETISHRRHYVLNRQTRIFNNLMKLAFPEGETILVDMYHMRNMERLALRLRSKVNFADFFDYQRLFPRDIPVDAELRQKISLTVEGDPFYRLLSRYLPFALPKCYVEDFGTCRGYAQVAGNGRHTVKAVGSAVGWFYNEPFKFFAAQLSIADAKMVEFQHGGGYGFFLSMLQERTAKEKDSFYMWGMGSPKEEKERYLPSPHLSRLKDTHRLKKDNALFISMSIPRYTYRFSTFLQPDDMPKYFEDERIFIARLKEDIRKQLLYRPYPIDYGWGEKEMLKKSFPGIHILQRGDLIQHLKGVRLAVINHPHTSFLEALVINIPCIFYWDHSVYLMREEAQNSLEPLRRAGILYRDPEAAAEKVNQVYNSSLDWWRSPEIQRVRNDFCRQYACADRNWIKAWSEEFRRYGSYANA